MSMLPLKDLGVHQKTQGKFYVLDLVVEPYQKWKRGIPLQSWSFR